MINFKEITKEDLKKDYSERHGFVFKGQHPSKKQSCETLSNSLINNKYTQVHPEFVVAVNDLEYIFVYPEGASFDAPRFITLADQAGHFIQMWDVELLSSYLK